VGGNACLYVDPRDAPAIADALTRVAQDEMLRRDLVRRGDRRLKEFSLRREAARLADYLEAAATGL
jgi:glycosyltransferase involved in cell wall biosynthesis